MCCRVRDLNSRLKAEQKNLERTRKQASPREKEPAMQREMDRTAEQVTLLYISLFTCFAVWFYSLITVCPYSATVLVVLESPKLVTDCAFGGSNRQCNSC